MLTKRDVDGAEPRATRYELWDGRNGLAGFGLRVTPQGVKTWVVMYRAGRRKRRLTLGGYPALTVQEARELARRKLADVLGGADPAALKTAAREAPTFAALAEAYMERHARPHKKTWKSDEARLRLHIAPALGLRPVAEVTAADVAQLHHEIGTRQSKPYEANRVLALVSVMFSHAATWGFVPAGHPNPAADVKKYREHKRDRFVTPAELPALVSAIDAEPNVYVRAALHLYLLTGARKRELLQVRWDDVDLDAGALKLADTKPGRPFVVRLSPHAVSILRALPVRLHNPYVFPGRNRGQHLVNLDKRWREVRAAAGLEDVRIHDLRRTFGSWLAMGGASLIAVGKALNHSNPATTAVYAHLTDDPIRGAVADLGRRMEAVTGTSLTPGPGEAEATTGTAGHEHTVMNTPAPPAVGGRLPGLRPARF